MTTAQQRDETATAGPRRYSIKWRIVLALLCGVAALLVAGWIERHAVLRETASLWIAADEPARSDAVAVFGGGLEYRPFAAAEYYHRGLAAKILVSNIGSSPAERLGVLQSHVQANFDVLQKLGVPATAIEIFGNRLTDTYDEANALHDWARRAGARTIMVPTDIFATRRLSWTLRHVFGADATILVPAIDPPEYRRDDWWKNERGVIAFQNEVLKYFYYRFKY
jgi:uncharacterized SAM-binding protein YcdF (DUF218 family)